MEKNDEKNVDFYSIILPGQNGLGGGSFIDYHIVNASSYSCYKVLEDPNLIDLGQTNCIKHFQEQFDNDPAFKDKNNRPPTIICGISQGSATIVNWLAQKSHEEQEKIARCVVLEAVLGSGNSAIKHTAKTEVPITASSLFPKFILPVAAKLAVFPSYKPWGVSAFESAKKLSPNIPIIIMHSVNDFQLSVNDARTLYCKLRENKNKNVYLFEVENTEAHIDVIWTEPREERLRKIAALQAIYKKHGLPYVEIKQERAFTIEEFQPSIEEVKNRK